MTLQATSPFASLLDADTVEVGGVRPVLVRPERAEAHGHDRGCWWDVAQCRWAGPAHPDRRAGR